MAQITGDVIGPDAMTERLIALYRDAVLQLEASLGAVLSRLALGTAAYNLTRLRLADAILAQLQASRQLATGTIVNAYRTGLMVGEAAAEGDRPPIGAGFGGIVHEDAVRLLAHALVSRLEPAEVTVGRKIRDVYQQIGVQHVATGLIAGATHPQIAQGIKDHLLHEGVTGFVDRAGRRWKLDTYAAMVARTTTREAVTQGTVNRLVDRGVDLITISSHPHPHDVCSPYDGKTFSLTGKTPGYPKIELLPPFHPNCKHVVTPARANLEAVERALGLVPTAPPDEIAEPPPPAPTPEPPGGWHVPPGPRRAFREAQVRHEANAGLRAARAARAARKAADLAAAAEAKKKPLMISGSELRELAGQPVVAPEIAPVDHAEVERALLSEPIHSIFELGGGINSTYTGKLESGMGVVIKPFDGLYNGQMRAQIEPGLDIERERAAYLVARRMGVNTPVLVAREVTGPRKPDAGSPVVSTTTLGLSTVQQRITGAVALHDTGNRGLYEPELRKIALFDATIGNLDRHFGNMLGLPPPGKTTWGDGEVLPIAIDHGLTFPEEQPRFGGNTYVQDEFAEKSELLREAVSTGVVEADRLQTSPYGDLSDEERAMLTGLLADDVTAELLGAGLLRASIETMHERIRSMLSAGAILRFGRMGR